MGHLGKIRKKLVQAFLMCRDPKSYQDFDVYAHYQFQPAAKKVQNSVIDQLNKDYNTFVTGHCLGGAVATLLAFFLYRKEVKVTKVIGFGLPKIHTSKGVETVKNLPLLRVTDHFDPVPGLFPGFSHSGPEIVLLKEKFFTYLRAPEEKELKMSTLDEEWLVKALEKHSMEYYLERIKPKIQSGAVPVGQGLDKEQFA